MDVPLRAAVAIAFVKAKREREAEGRLWKTQAETLGCELRQLRGCTLALAQLLHTHLQEGAGGSEPGGGVIGGGSAANGGSLGKACSGTAGRRQRRPASAGRLASESAAAAALSAAAAQFLPGGKSCSVQEELAGSCSAQEELLRSLLRRFAGAGQAQEPPAVLSGPGLTAHEQQQRQVRQFQLDSSSKPSSAAALAERKAALWQLLQGMHALQAAATSHGQRGANHCDDDADVRWPGCWPSQQPHQVVLRFMAGPLVGLPGSELRQAYITYCSRLLSTMLHSSRGGADVDLVAEHLEQAAAGPATLADSHAADPEPRAPPCQATPGATSAPDGDVASDVFAALQQLLGLCCSPAAAAAAAPGAPQPQQVPAAPLDAAGRPDCWAPRRPDAAQALLRGLARGCPLLGQLLLMACTTRLSATAATLLQVFRSCGPGSTHTARSEALRQAAAEYEGSAALFELLDACLAMIPAWCMGEQGMRLPQSAAADGGALSQPSKRPHLGTAAPVAGAGVGVGPASQGEAALGLAGSGSSSRAGAAGSCQWGIAATRQAQLPQPAAGGSYLRATAVGFAAVFASLPALQPHLPLFCASAVGAMAALASALQHVALAPELAACARRAECLQLSRGFKDAFLPAQA